MTSFQTFTQLHHQANPLLIGNIWDVNSARLFERNDFKAVATSSAAVAHAQGYDDGEQLPFEVLVQLAKRVAKEVAIPLSVDIEAGYSNSIAGILQNIDKLCDAGVVGINMEDSVPGRARSLQPAHDFQKIVTAVAEHLSKTNKQLFINVRTDGFLLALPNALEVTLSRIKAYENAGASGIFTPCITQVSDIRNVVQSTKLPVNVMAMPTLPSFDELTALGVKRISMGNALHDFLNTAMEKTIQRIQENQNFTELFHAGRPL